MAPVGPVTFSQRLLAGQLRAVCSLGLLHALTNNFFNFVSFRALSQSATCCVGSSIVGSACEKSIFHEMYGQCVLVGIPAAMSAVALLDLPGCLPQG